MALVAAGFDLNVTLIDNGENTATLTYHLVAADAAAAATAADTILDLITPVTQAVVKTYSISQRFIEDDLALPVSGVQVENRASIVTRLDGSAVDKHTVVIPAAAPGLFTSLSGEGANIIDVLDTDLVAYIDIWRVTGALASLSDGEFLQDGLNAIVKGTRKHRQSSYG